MNCLVAMDGEEVGGGGSGDKSTEDACSAKLS